MSVYERTLQGMPVLQSDDERRAAESLERLVSVSLRDCKRRRDGQVGSLSFLYELKAVMRDGAGALEHAYCTRANELKGWSYGLPARNPIQWLVAVINELVLSAAGSIIEIEEQHPQLRRRFDSERAERARAAKTA